MKKFLFFGALAAMLLGAASCSNDMEPAMSGDGTVSFKVELPGAIESRAISDGTTAVKLDVACYDADGNYLDIEPTVKTDFVNRVATVTYKLVKGQKYNFAFFAHAEVRSTTYPRVNIYSFEPGEKFEDCKFVFNGNRTVSDYANNEERDAFYGTLTDYEVTSAETTVTLTRPFAQLNLGTDDLEAAIAAGIEPRNVRIWIPKVSKSFNIATGVASDDEADTGLFYFYNYTDPSRAMPYKRGETLTVDGKDYTWISMNYILVPANEANIDVKVTIHTTDLNTNEDGEDFEFNVSNVPVKKNHRTNIVGSLLTADANFNVVIDQNYDTPDNNVEYPEVTDVAIVNGQQYETLDAAIAAAETGATITLAPGTYNFSSLNKSVKIVGKSKERSIVEFINKAYGCNSADVYFENLTLRVGRENYKGFQHSNSETYKNIIFEGGHLTLYGTTATFDGCTFNQSIYDYCFWAYGPTTTTVTNCVFNTVGKAIKFYQESRTITRTLNVSNTTFNVTERGNGTSAIKAAIEIDGTLIQVPFALNVTNTTVNGHDPGEASGSTLWNCDAGSKATVVVDGETVYQQN